MDEKFWIIYLYIVYDIVNDIFIRYIVCNVYVVDFFIGRFKLVVKEF